MTKGKKALIIAIALGVLLAVVIGVILLLPKNGNDNPVDTTGGKDNVNDEPITYTVEVTTEGGTALSDIGVYVYTDKTL